MLKIDPRHPSYKVGRRHYLEGFLPHFTTDHWEAGWIAACKRSECVNEREAAQKLEALMRTRPYYTLLVREPEGLWGPQFGDYSRAVVAQELIDTRDDWPRGTTFKIIKTGGRQKDITAAVAAENNKEWNKLVPVS